MSEIDEQAQQEFDRMVEEAEVAYRDEDAPLADRAPEGPLPILDDGPYPSEWTDDGILDQFPASDDDADSL